MTQAATLFIIAAPSGAGKTSLVQALISQTKNLVVSVSHTTRPQRNSEEDGINYHFINKPEFEKMINEQAFLEHATVFGNYYGTSKKWVKTQLAQGIDVILEIDWQGAQQVRQHNSFATQSIFILPPSLQALKQRLARRGQDTQAVMDARLAGAQHEMQHYREFDYLVVNDDFTTALEDLSAIVRVARLQRALQVYHHAPLLDNLLKTT